MDAMTDEAKFLLFVKIANLFLEDDLTVEADSYIKQGQPLKSRYIINGNVQPVMDIYHWY